MYTARTCTCMHTCTHTFIPWSARVRSFLRASSSACALALLFVASCAQSPFVCVCECVCVCVTVCVYVCGECNRDHHSEFLRAGMHAPPASCQRELTVGTKSRQREEASEGLKHASGSQTREKGSFIHNAKHAKGTEQSKTLGSRLGSLY